MAIASAYLITTKNLEAFFNALRSAKAPERVTNVFLKQLDFTSSNDRLLIGVLKALGMIDESGVPTKRYFAFLDQSESGRILAEAVREAYEDLFALNKRAQELSLEEVKNKFRTLTQGQKSDLVVTNMANTFKALSALADWKATKPDSTPEKLVTEPVQPPMEEEKEVRKSQTSETKMSLHHDIHIHLPESRDPAVFDAIFSAMKKHIGV